MGKIYKIRHIESGRLYIGQTIYSLRRRFNQHIKNAYSAGSHCYNSHLQKAIRKYGAEAFEIEEIEKCDDSLLDEREKYWIKFYDTVHKGFNMAYGGAGTPRYDSSDFLREWNNGLSVTEISKKLGTCDRTVSAHLINGGVTKEEIRKRGYESIKGKVYQYDLDGNYIAEYPTAAAAERAFKRNGIANILDNPEKSACGFLWSRRKADHIEPYCGFTSRKEVHQYSADGDYIKSYKSVGEAAREVGCSHANIVAVCNGKVHACYGYRWSYEKTEKLPKLKRKIIKWGEKVS